MPHHTEHSLRREGAGWAAAPSADISNCDREPIHIPGSIQPHGVMLLADPADLTVRHVAGDVERLFGTAAEPGRQLAGWIGKSLAFMALAKATTGPTFIGTVTALPVAIDVVVHLSGGFLIVELEAVGEPTRSSTDLLGTLSSASRALDRASTLYSLCEAAVVEFRNLTQYDRVMVYRFLEDGTGAVIAEDRRPDLHSFLNHRFPGSDIPQQARALYVLNLIRVIPDANYVPAGFRPPLSDNRSLDMSNCALRSVSPIHVQYLKNMGVAASASVSIAIDGRLWGLIACHSETPRTIPYGVRMVCQTLGSGLARHIKSLSETDIYRERLRLRGFKDEAVRLLSQDDLPESRIEQELERLSGLITASGFAFVRGDRLYLSGICPATAEIMQLSEWLAEAPERPLFSTEQLTAHYGAAENFRDIAAGMLAITLCPERRWFLMWFCAEEVQIINWAGNPHKSVDLQPGETLSPRASFEDWQETVHGRCRSWTPAELEIVETLRHDLTNVWQGQRLRELNRRLLETLAEKDQLLEQKQFLIGEVNHRVQNSLQLVSGFLARQAREFGDEKYSHTIEEARQRINAVSLLHRRLYRGDDVSVTDAGGYIAALCDNLIASLGPEWKRHFFLRLDPVMLPIDSVIPLGLLAVELVINISKYAYDGQPGPVEMALSEDRRGFRFTVADKGRGLRSNAPGFGTRMIQAFIDELSGDLTLGDNHPGLLAVLVAPKTARK